MRYLTPSLLALLAMTLSGCSFMPTRPTPAPVSEVIRPAATHRAPRPGGVQVYPYRAEPAAVAAPIVTPTPWASAPLPAAAASPPAVSRTPTALASLTPPPSALPLAASGNAPVQALLKQAEAQRAAGDLVSAAATLERGMRIEPRNPFLWNRLARIRLQQGQFGQADSLAAKSNTLAGNLPALMGDNQRIIAEARRKAGR